MAAYIPINVVAGILECKVCLGRFRDPKTLVCHHVFCKECLEDIIKFTADGSAVIPCPLRCPNETYIDENKTLNDLGTAFEIKAMLETLNLSDDQSLLPVAHICTYTKDCDKEISVYCCGFTMCEYCYKKHNETQVPHEGKTNVIIDANDGQLVVMCGEHLSPCKHVCIDATHGNSTKFLCIYCINRNHKEHLRDTVEEQARKMKEALTSISTNIENLCKIRKVTEENISLCRKKLDAVLRERKEECLTKYIDLLNREEERIRSEFVNVIDKHIEQYPASVDSDYYKEKLLKDGSGLVLEKSTTLNTICKRNFMHLSFSCVDVSVSDSMDFQSQHPLGNLNVSAQTFTDLEPHMTTFKDNITSNCSNYERISAKLSQQLKELVQDHDSSHELEMNRVDQEVKRLTHLGQEYISKLVHSPIKYEKKDSESSIMLNINRLGENKLLEELNLIPNESGVNDLTMARGNSSPSSPSSSGYKSPPLLPPSYFQSSESEMNTNISTDSPHRRPSRRHADENISSRSLDNIDSNSAENATVTFIPTSIKDLVVGMKINFSRKNGGFSRGTIKWLGTLHKHSGDYVGVELEGEVGKHDGTVHGIQYFKCKAGQGKFVNFKYVVIATKL